MADLVITAANVAKGAHAALGSGTAGVAITAGQVLYLDAGTQRHVLTDNDGDGTRQAEGIALNAAAAGQPITFLKGGEVTIGAVLTPGMAYYASDTAGGIIPHADLAVGMDVILVGIAVSASVLSVSFRNTGVEL